MTKAVIAVPRRKSGNQETQFRILEKEQIFIPTGEGVRLYSFIKVLPEPTEMLKAGRIQVSVGDFVGLAVPPIPSQT